MNKIILFIAAALGLSAGAAHAQINNAKTETVKVSGNCEMCEATIEKAGTKSKVSKAEWNKDTRLATITYDPGKTNLDAILKNIALAGYDNQSYLAPGEAYNKLRGCCKYERTLKQPALAVEPVPGNTATTDNHAHHHAGAPNKAAADTSQIAPVMEKYFALKDALVQSESNTAAARAKDLQAALEAVKMDQLPADVHTKWMQVANDLKKEVARISNARSLEIQRQAFSNTAKNMYELVKVAKITAPIYYQRCPMYNDGKGANWLSKESAIKNPYYGAQMLTCGSTLETIKP
jgi:copper chaperone CopZ